ncbi:MAG: hypothetical protein LAT61_15175 [Alcanivorax sp.]|nr:hypothetical protein [Alcanivorax sp.]
MAHTAPTQPSTSAVCPTSWRPAAWLWLLLVLPGLLASGAAQALHHDGPASQRSLDHPAMVLVRDLPGHQLVQPCSDADDTPALTATTPPGSVPPCSLRTPLPRAPALASDRLRHPGNPRAPPSRL